jgi:hypothetical protein
MELLVAVAVVCLILVLIQPAPRRRYGGGYRPRGCGKTAASGQRCARGPDHSPPCRDITQIRPPKGGGGVHRGQR